MCKQVIKLMVGLILGIGLPIGIANAQIEIMVPQICTVCTQAVAFGAYNPFSGLADDSTGMVIISCTKNSVSYSIAMSQGASGYFQPRTMLRSGGGSSLNYNLYIDAARNLIWGDGTSGTNTVSRVGASCNKAPYCRHQVYGRITASQTTVNVGSYADTITVTVNY